jgi:hypothetical protein
VDKLSIWNVLDPQPLKLERTRPFVRIAPQIIVSDISPHI